MLKFQKISVLALALSASLTTIANTEVANTKDESYALGALFGVDAKNIIESQKEVVSYQKDKLLVGMKDALEGKVDLQNPELVATLQSIENKLKTAREQKAAEKAKKVQQDNEQFIAEFKKKNGVKQTKSGLLYRIEQIGKGDSPKATDIVKVHYTGKLTNGEVFDSSVARGQPAEFALNQVITGWTEGLQLIKKGGKIELVIPAQLAYGEQDMGKIPANATLYFEVELLDINPKK